MAQYLWMLNACLVCHVSPTTVGSWGHQFIQNPARQRAAADGDDGSLSFQVLQSPCSRTASLLMAQCLRMLNACLVPASLSWPTPAALTTLSLANLTNTTTYMVHTCRPYNPKPRKPYQHEHVYGAENEISGFFMRHKSSRSIPLHADIV